MQRALGTSEEMEGHDVNHPPTRRRAVTSGGFGRPDLHKPAALPCPGPDHALSGANSCLDQNDKHRPLRGLPITGGSRASSRERTLEYRVERDGYLQAESSNSGGLVALFRADVSI